MENEFKEFKESRKHRMRLSIDIPIDMHKKVRFKSLFHNCTISTWVKRAILDRMAYEDQFTDVIVQDDPKEPVLELREDIVTTNESTPEGVQVP